MQKARTWLVTLVSLMLALTWACASENAPRLDKETLKSWLSDPKVVILDVRAPKDWDGSNTKD